MAVPVKALLIFASLFALLLPLQAQEPEIQRSLRILCLGDPPPFIQEVRDGARYEVDPPKGSVPPPKVNIRGIKIEGNKTTFSPRLRLATKRQTFTAGEDAVLLLETPEGKEWLRAPLPKMVNCVLVLWRAKSDTWEKPRYLFVEDEVPAGSVRVHNLTNSMKGVAFGSRKLKVTPGKASTLSFPEGASKADFALFYQEDDQSIRSFHTTTLTADDSLDQQFFIYAADVKDSRVPFKMISLLDPKIARKEG